MSESRDNGTDDTRSFVPITKGTVISHYEIIEKIGAGGMGEVFLAEDTELSRKVALKFLPPHLCQDEDCRARFKREAQAAAVLEHPNIVTIHEVSEHQGRPYIVMQYVEGRSLRDTLREKELTIDEIVDLAIQVCEGLTRAHKAGIIHRDIKPSNICISSDGRPKLLDFGLAAVLGSDHLTKTGSTLGTAGYMSPEQAQGRVLDHRSDLFSFGVVLYEMITRQNPFKRDSEAATLKAVCDDTPEPLARYRTGIPESLQAILVKALDKNQDMRYQTAADLATDIKRISAGISTSERKVLSERKHSRKSMLIVALSTVIIAALGLIAVLNLFKDNDAYQVVPVFKRVTSYGDVDICDLSPDGTYLAYSRLIREGHTEVMVDDIEGGKPFKVFESRIIRTLRWSPNGKELLIEAGDDTSSTAFIVSRFGGDTRRYDISFVPTSRSLLWHPDAQKFVHMTFDSSLVTMDKLTGDASSVRTEFRFARLLDWSANGNLILFHTFVEDGGGFLGVMRPDGSGLQRLVETAHREAVFSAGGDAVFLAEGLGILNRLMRLPIDPVTGIPRGNAEVLLPSVPMFSHLSISADGGRLLMRQRIASSNLHKVLLAPESGQISVETEPITFGTGFHSVPSISPDGEFIAFADYTQDSYQIFVIPAEGGERRQLTYSGLNLAGDWSPDSRQLAYFKITDISAKEVFISLVDLSRGTSRDLVRYSIMAGNALDWAPGRNIVTRAPNLTGIWLINPETGDTTTLPLAESEVAIRNPHYSPDTSLVAFHWDRDGQEPDGIWTLSLIDGQTRFIANFDANIFGWSPDGEWIYFRHMGEDGLLRIARVHLESADVQTMAVLQWDVPNSLNWVDLAPDASWAVIEKETSQTDVWVVDNFDPNVK